MIAKTIVYGCRNCGSQNPEHCQEWTQCLWQPTILVQRLWQVRCLEPKHSYSAEQKEQILAAYTNERSSMRGIQRTFSVSRNMLTSWLKKTNNIQNLMGPYCQVQSEDILEVRHHARNCLTLVYHQT